MENLWLCIGRCLIWSFTHVNKMNAKTKIYWREREMRGENVHSVKQTQHLHETQMPLIHAFTSLKHLAFFFIFHHQQQQQQQQHFSFVLCKIASSAVTHSTHLWQMTYHTLFQLKDHCEVTIPVDWLWTKTPELFLLSQKYNTMQWNSQAFSYKTINIIHDHDFHKKHEHLLCTNNQTDKHDNNQ